MWGKSRFTSATVTVEADLTLLKEKLHQILPTEKIGAEAVGDSIVLSGEVSGPMAQSTALALALPYAGGKKDKVVNVMHVGGVQQVMLEVRVAEINRLIAERIGVNFNALAPQGNFGVNQINSLAGVSGLVRQFTGSGSSSTTSFVQALSPALTAMGGWTAAGTLWSVFLDLLKQQNLGRVLAEPNLTTTSGQKASFLAGGEYPIPVPQSGVGGAATITIEYKKYGVQLEFTPTVLNESKIAVQVHPIVSELDTSLGVSFTLTGGYVVPALRLREMDTHIEVNDGQTFAIAGLLQDQSRNIITKFPLLGDIPVLGALFRSTQYQKNLTELVALVTPHLVKPMPPGAARLPTDKWIDPNDVDVYLLGLEQGRQKPDSGVHTRTGGAAADGIRPPVPEIGARRRRESHGHKGNESSQSLERLALGLALLGLAGCYPPSALEMDYGNSVRNNVAQQVVNPNAGFNPKPAVGLPPQAAAGEMEKYDKSFKAEEKKALEMKMS